MEMSGRGEMARPTKETVKARLRESGLDIPDECIEGTVRNIIVLQDHAATLNQFEGDETRPLHRIVRP